MRSSRWKRRRFRATDCRVARSALSFNRRGDLCGLRSVTIDSRAMLWLCCGRERAQRGFIRSRSIRHSAGAESDARFCAPASAMRIAMDVARCDWKCAMTIAPPSRFMSDLIFADLAGTRTTMMTAPPRCAWKNGLGGTMFANFPVSLMRRRLLPATPGDKVGGSIAGLSDSSPS